MLVKLIAFLVFLIVLTFFVTENFNEKVNLKLFTYSLPETPAIALILISMIFGVLLTFPFYFRQKFVSFKLMRNKKKQIKSLKKENKAIQKDQPILITHDDTSPPEQN